MGIFGWDLPPGVTMRDIDPPEQPCGVCGKMPDSCICPLCPKCEQYGNPDCYVNHGMERTSEQIASHAEFIKKCEEQNRLDNEQAEAYYEEMDHE